MKNIFESDPEDPNKLRHPVVVDFATETFRAATPAEALQYAVEESKRKIYRPDTILVKEKA